VTGEYVVVSAGEPSGDYIGAQCVHAITQWLSQLALEQWGGASNIPQGQKVQVVGIGGPLMQEQGLWSCANLRQSLQSLEAPATANRFDLLAQNGFGAVLRHLPFLWKVTQKMMQLVKSPQCLAVILIDYPGMNMRLLQAAQRHNKPVLYIAPPQFWAWKKHRSRYFDGVAVLCFFEWEVQACKQANAQVRQITHPFVKQWPQPMKYQHSKTSCALGGVLLFAGSRVGVFARNIGYQLQLAQEYCGQAKHPQRIVVIIPYKQGRMATSVQKLLWRRYPEQMAQNSIELHVLQNNGMLPEWIGQNASAWKAITIAGTNTLSLALQNICQIVYMPLPPLFYWWAQRHIQSPYISLPNLIVGQKRVQEVIFSTKSSEHIQCHCKKALQYLQAMGRHGEDSFTLSTQIYAKLKTQDMEQAILEWIGDQLHGKF
jgi:lipid-A-disaccharide synthase